MTDVISAAKRARGADGVAEALGLVSVPARLHITLWQVGRQTGSVASQLLPKISGNLRFCIDRSFIAVRVRCNIPDVRRNSVTQQVPVRFKKEKTLTCSNSAETASCGVIGDTYVHTYNDKDRHRFCCSHGAWRARGASDGAHPHAEKQG
jgi:hypothetical protein